jgi:predicted acylesterase/phospholipase RssA
VDADRDARAVIAGADRSAAALAGLAGELRDAGRAGLVVELLIAVSRRALDGSWRPGERAALAEVLRDHQQFAYARRLLGRVRGAADSEALRQQHALCTYKDQELPAERRLDRALAILEEGGPLQASHSAETLGIAGAICKRRWQLDGDRAQLERALSNYRRGLEQDHDPARWYAGINAAFISDQLAALEDDELIGSGRVAALRAEADGMRKTIADSLVGEDGGWNDATRGEALFGLGRFAEAREALAAAGSRTKDLWRLETTAMQLAALARLRGATHDPAAIAALDALVGGRAGALGRAAVGKVGLALSGGGYRASLFHIGVLARLAECRVLRHIEVLSCVSGGSIIGAYYYVELRRLLETKPDGEISDEDYVALVRSIADRFLASVRKNLRGRLFTSVRGNARMLATRYSRTDRVSELLEQHFFGPVRMPQLIVAPAGERDAFTLRYENWLREAKVPVLVLNATTLNTGHVWQFTATWMGEPPSGGGESPDASRRLLRVHYRDAPDEDALRRPRLSTAVAASACVPGLFAPIRIERLFHGVAVELVDGGVHDNQGVASLIEEDCAVILVSDASGQLRDADEPKRWLLSVLKRSNDILMKRVRGAQYSYLLRLRRAGALRGFMTVHLTKGLPAPPRAATGSAEQWAPEDDATAPTAAPYGIDPAVQRALAELRTDLDAFTREEAYALMGAGYRMTEHELPPILRELGPPLRATWPFAETLRRMQGDDAHALADALRPGAELLFRKPKAWLRRPRVARG